MARKSSLLSRRHFSGPCEAVLRCYRADQSWSHQAVDVCAVSSHRIGHCLRNVLESNLPPAFRCLRPIVSRRCFLPVRVTIPNTRHHLTKPIGTPAVVAVAGWGLSGLRGGCRGEHVGSAECRCADVSPVPGSTSAPIRRCAQRGGWPMTSTGATRGLWAPSRAGVSGLRSRGASATHGYQARVRKRVRAYRNTYGTHRLRTGAQL